MNFKMRKIFALAFAIVDVFLAYYLHNYRFGLFVFIISILMLGFIWFRNFFSKYSTSVLYQGEPILFEITGWVFLCVILFYAIVAVNNF